MASTNKTVNYDLSQYIGTDKPTYLSDYNGDMYKIDAQMKENADNIATAISSSESAISTANQANTTAQNAQTTANQANTTASQADSVAQTAQTTANSALSSATNVDTKIGNLSNLNTYDKTNIVNAINEINSSENYSTTEIKTNKTWVDGKPIYKKVVTGTLPTTNYSVFITITDLDTPVNENILITNRDGSKARLPFVQLINNTYCDYYIEGNQYHVHYSIDTYKGDSFVAILEYTKTTD